VSCRLDRAYILFAHVHQARQFLHEFFHRPHYKTNWTWNGPVSAPNNLVPLRSCASHLAFRKILIQPQPIEPVSVERHQTHWNSMSNSSNCALAPYVPLLVHRVLGFLTTLSWFGRGENLRDHDACLRHLWRDLLTSDQVTFWGSGC